MNNPIVNKYMLKQEIATFDNRLRYFSRFT